ncbi:undecaprenyldiphospho-muramoylpentapeptide beta-N-acetylglucosaminyltransferase [Sulfoacidibacillus thermotolerans]|uniref:UDP-N-acetylglucosamine--N-acetylmuramyl-(pentapeptide) pyrophosphoryl-undecaprenol N-acetylglucosamine transferase n=1 Tax=Sulfoacidibacillus thermotolerans TaxID=1765684 RepID=A0A2U3DAK2_SULT2|nr:undecaprenyldiphospho-muramoylpentapeptide beta-N-acetylglucosaminyltransferase [Sulfoacidibacillus thermotolerans]PWI58316.1 undecaprenyldiphospho-muramoylpentapeptide beta-N-acetylglucosaminyltransferase [Sulfoacidibacillus thermotolerans]
MTNKIILTGGGSAGHVTVNLALLPKLQQDGFEVIYIGSEEGIERELIVKCAGVRYYAIKTGKLRRYFDWKNFKDPFNVLTGAYQAYEIIRKERPRVIFSKGGFVSVPVVIGGWLNRTPIIIHESDVTPGLANRIAIPFATKVCTTFQETSEHLPPTKAQYVGAVVREELARGSATAGLTFLGFSRNKPTILAMGGSLGSKRINEVIHATLHTLLKSYQVIHICGKGQVDPSLNRPGYRQFEYVTKELPDLLAVASLVISRAGANAIFEFLSLQKPMVLIPLPKSSSRGDQIINAKSFQERGYCEVIPDEELSAERLLQVVNHVYEQRLHYIEKMQLARIQDPLQTMIHLIETTARRE